MKKKDSKDTTKFYSKEIKVKQIKSDDYKTIVSFIVALVIIGVLTGLLFLFNGKYVSKDLNKAEETTTTTKVKYDDSLLTVDTMFSKKGEYYVLAYDAKDDISGSFYNSLAISYKNDKTSLYTIDLSIKMNSAYYNKKKATVVKKDEINFKEATLVTIKDGKVTATTSDRTEITKLLTNK